MRPARGLVLGWRRGLPGRACFATDQHRVSLRSFRERQFELHGVDAAVPDLDAETAAPEVLAVAAWQTRLVSTVRHRESGRCIRARGRPGLGQRTVQVTGFGGRSPHLRLPVDAGARVVV